MDIYRIILLGLGAAVAAAAVKSQRPDIALAVSLCGGLAVLMLSVDKLAAIISGIADLTASAGIDSGYIQTAVKLTGVAFLCDFAVNICHDAGQSAIAAKVEFAGKAALIAMVLPVMGSLLGLAGELMRL